MVVRNLLFFFLAVPAMSLLTAAACQVQPRPDPKPEPAPAPAPSPVESQPLAVAANVREMKRVTSFPSAEFYPRLSPSGDMLMFTSFDSSGEIVDGSRYSISAVKPDGGEARTSIAGPYAGFGQWTKDGKYIVYVRMHGACPMLVRAPFGTGVGSGMTFISSRPLGDADSLPAPSPDGSKILFETIMSGTRCVCMVNSDGTNFTVLAEGSEPSWHPNGDQFVFSKRIGNHSQIYHLSLVTGQTTMLIQGEGHSSRSPSYSPDGSKILYLADRDGKFHLYIWDGKNQSQLTEGNSPEDTPHWGVDGWIYFASSSGIPIGSKESASTRSSLSISQNSNIWRLQPKFGE